MMENSALVQEQQLVYRIDCDKHTTLGGAPPILVLQKDSVQPPILILSGMQTYPLRTPVIKDERRNKSQGYIVQDERKPPPPNHTGTLPYMSTSRGETGYPYQHPVSASVPNDPQQHMHLPADQSSQDPSNSRQQVPNLGPNSNWSFGGTQQPPYNTMPSADGNIPPGGPYGCVNPSSQSYYRQQQPHPTAGPSSWTTQSPASFNNNFAPGDRMMMYGRRGPMTPGAAAPTMNCPSSTWPPYSTNDNGATPYQQQQQYDTTPYQPWSNRNTYDHPRQQAPPFPQHPTNPAFASTVQQPTVINGARRSKSVSFAPLPNFVAT